MPAVLEQNNVTIGYYKVEDVMTILGCQRTKAQDVIRELNCELVNKGYKKWPKGKISKRYFQERYF
ncbi:MAG: transcriptional regulator [Velocimicrobium sp.]